MTAMTSVIMVSMLVRCNYVSLPAAYSIHARMSHSVQLTCDTGSFVVSMYCCISNEAIDMRRMRLPLRCIVEEIQCSTHPSGLKMITHVMYL